MLNNIKNIITPIFVSFCLLLTCISPVFAQDDVNIVKVNDNSYVTITEALSTLETSTQEQSHTITLLNDIVLESPLILPDKTIVLDGAGFMITSDYSITVKGSLSINNVVLNMEQADILASNGNCVSFINVSGKVRSVPEAVLIDDTELVVSQNVTEQISEIEETEDTFAQKEESDTLESGSKLEKSEQLENGWIVIPSVTNTEYGQTLIPTAEAIHGNDTIKFTYADKFDGEYHEEAPKNVGTWYLKTELLETEEYKGLTEIVEFIISAKPVTTIIVPEVDEKTNIKELEIKDGEKVLLLGTDYKIVTQTENETTTVTITFMGNYTGEIIKTYTVEKEVPKEEQKEENKNETKENEKQDKEKKEIKKNKSVKTATSTNQVIWITLLSSSLVLIGVIFFVKKKTKKAD